MANRYMIKQPMRGTTARKPLQKHPYPGGNCMEPNAPQGGVCQLRREDIRPLGARDSAATGHCVVPVRGSYNPLGPEYNHPG